MNNGDDIRDLEAFRAVFEEASFTRAAARLGVSQSALSQTIRGLEARLGIRLFARTTRRVSPTEAGERLLGLVGPAMKEIGAGLAQIREMRDKPAGTIRLTADDYAVQSVLMPALKRFLPHYPDIQVEITTDYGMTDIVADRYDAGVRRGALVPQDMIAAQIGPEIPMVVIGAPAYFAKRSRPKRPQDLSTHACISLRLPTHGEVYTWIFRKGARTHRIRCNGPLVLSGVEPILRAAIAGLGLAWLPEEMVRPHVEAGDLIQVLDDWSHTLEAYHLYYPNRRHSSRVFSLLLEALRYRR